MKSRKKLHALSMCAALVLLLMVAGVGLVPGLQWRSDVILKKATGDLDDLSWLRLISMIKPNSGFWLQRIAEGRSLHAAIQNPYRSETDIEHGESIFRSQCSACHVEHAAESGAPDLSEGNFKNGDSDWALFKAITEGVPGSAMVSSTLQDREVWQVIAYVRALQDDEYSAPGQRSKPNISISDVTYERLKDSSDHADDWLSYSGSYNGQRYSSLDQIDQSTVQDLRVQWVYQLPTDEPHSESTPLVIDNVMFLTASPDLDLAVDAGTGELLWQRRRALPSNLALCCGPHNRGMAILNRTLYRGTLDGHLIARDARTGDLLWDVEVGDPSDGFSITAAPLAVRNKIVTGVAGGEFGIRGYLDAYDAETGTRVWRLYTIPATGEPGNDTWSGNSWMHGGGATWMTGSYDSELGLVYWGVGNPAPDFNGDERQGDNLFTNSLLAIDAETGVLQWHFQFTPHDLHDWDANQVPVLVNAEVNGSMRKLVLTASKNGFAYVLDRTTGEFLLAHEVAAQTWAEGFDPDGRPIRKPGIDPSPEGTFLRPSAGGGANWWPPSYNPLTGLVHYSVADSAAIYFKSDTEFREGTLFVGSGGQRPAGDLKTVAIRAVKAGTSQLAWEYTSEPRVEWPGIGVSLTTGGKLVLFGDNQHFLALDAETGEVLWRINLGAPIHAAPVTYVTNEKQHIAVTAGRSIYSFSIPD